jgi:hypothetical protein
MAETERSIYFYKVEMHEGEWSRREVLEGLAALTGDERLLDLGSDDYAWAKVDHIPRTSEYGRLRFFRDRRANLPGMSNGTSITELPIPDEAGLVEPTHVVLAGDGLIAAEYNHFAPRITSNFASLLRTRLDMSLSIGTFVPQDVAEQLDRLEGVQLLEVSLVSTPELEDELRNSGPFGEAAMALSRVDDGRRLYLRLSGDKDSDHWALRRWPSPSGCSRCRRGRKWQRCCVSKAMTQPRRASRSWTSSKRSWSARRTWRSSARCKALDVGSAYQVVEDAIREVRKTDLPQARVIYSR